METEGGLPVINRLCLTGGLPEHPPARYKKTESPFKDGSTFFNVVFDYEKEKL